MNPSPRVVVRLFGTPEITSDGAAVGVDTRKAIALMAYLAASGRAVSRDVLCYLLWPESSQARARGALRRTLSSLRAVIGAENVEAGRDAVFLSVANLEVNIVTFASAVHDGEIPALEASADLYRGDLMAGFSLRRCPEFEDWQRTEGERLRRDADGVFAKLANQAASLGHHDRSILLAERRLELDPLNEPAHRMLPLTEAWAGRRGRAIERYRDAVRVLED